MNSKDLWKRIEALSKTQVGIPDILPDDGSLHCELDKSNACSGYFHSVFSTYRCEGSSPKFGIPVAVKMSPIVHSISGMAKLLCELNVRKLNIWS